MVAMHRHRGIMGNFSLWRERRLGILNETANVSDSDT
jgi:hypothetical protein